MSKQTVFRLKAKNSADDLAASEEPIPSVEKYEVLIKVRGITLNYRDIAISKSQYPFAMKDDLVPGSDAAGDVVKVGEGVRDLKAGDRVIGCFDVTNQYGPQQDWNWGQGGPIDGVMRQYLTLPSSAVVKIPEGTPQSYLEWACLCAGTGGVSITGLIFAKAAGATTIITSSSDEKLEYVKSKFRPDHVINYKKTPNWGEVARKLTGGKGVDQIFENGGSATIEQSVAAIAQGGIISIIGFLALAEQSNMPDVTQLALGSGSIIRGINVGSKQLLEDCVRFVAKAGLRLPVEKEFGFSRDEIVGAYEYLESGQHIGKVCIRVE